MAIDFLPFQGLKIALLLFYIGSRDNVPKAITMKTKTPDFTATMLYLASYYELEVLFKDFLQMSLSVFSPTSRFKKFGGENLFYRTFSKYSSTKLKILFPQMFSMLMTEMKLRESSLEGNDILGEFYSQYIEGLVNEYDDIGYLNQIIDLKIGGPKKTEAIRLIHFNCKSGKLLVQLSKRIGRQHSFCGVEDNQLWVIIASINFYFNGLNNSEILYTPNFKEIDQQTSYRTSSFPPGIFPAIGNKTFISDLLVGSKPNHCIVLGSYDIS